MIKQLTKKLISPQSKSEDKRRHEFILNVLLLYTITLLLLASSLIALLRPLLEAKDGNGMPLWAILSSVAFLTWLYSLSRKGRVYFSAFMLVGTYFFLSIYMIFLWGIEVQAALLFFVLSIVLSGILINALTSFWTAVLAGLVLFLGYVAQIKRFYSPNLIWKSVAWGGVEISVIIFIFLLIATLSWLSNREIEKSLNRARRSEKALKKERDLLEIRVKEKTEELKKAQMEKMAELSRFAEFGRLSSGIFHDLVNPLTALSLNIEMAKRNQANHENFQDAEEDLDKAITATRRMSKLINSVKKQITKDKDQELFCLNDEINEAIQILSYQARKKNASITFSAKSKIKTFANPIKFNQVVSNLISNALDAFPENETTEKETGGRVEIGLKIEKNEITLSVKDNGQGIPDNEQNKIFKPFFSTKKFSHGTGIGLSLAQSIVKKDFGGKIRVKSKENQGAEFIINFKQQNPYAKNQPAPFSAAKKQQIKK